MSDVDSIFFDITTCSQWSGRPVGIIRVERELAARARRQIGERLSYCVFDKAASEFLIVRDEYVSDILAGDANIDFSARYSDVPIGKKHVRDILIQIPWLYRIVQHFRGHKLSREDVQNIRLRVRRHATSASAVWKGRFRSVALEVPIVYQAIQLLRGQPLSLSEIKLIRQRTSPLFVRASRPRLLPIAVATSRSVALGENVVIVSGGLDWEHKDIAVICQLRKNFGFRFISIVYDLIPINLPHYVVPRYVNLLTEYFGELLWTSDGCLCISETTRLDLIEYFDANGVSPPKAVSFPLGSNLNEQLQTEEIPPVLSGKKFVLFVSTIEPRKNHRTVYEAWCHAILNEMINTDECRLVFVGMQGWNTGDLVHEISTNPLTRNNIIIMSDVSDEQLVALYREAAFVIFPSFYEGFGLPLAEAFGCGKVCVTSGVGALREIGDGLRIDVDPRDTLGWSSVMAELLDDSEKISDREAKIAGQYSAVSWDDSAKIFFEALQDVVR